MDMAALSEIAIRDFALSLMVQLGGVKVGVAAS